MNTVTLTPQPGIDALVEARRYRLMLEQLDLHGIIANEELVSELVLMCKRQLQKQFRGDNFVWVDPLDAGQAFSIPTAVQLALKLSEDGQWMVIPCYEPYPHTGGDQWQDCPSMIRISKLGSTPSRNDEGLQAFRPCKEFQRWW